MMLTSQIKNTVHEFSFSNFVYLFQELDEIKKSGMKVFRDIYVDESNILSWKGLIVPVCIPFPCSSAIIE